MENSNIRKIGQNDAAYPARLKAIKDAPKELYVLGTLPEGIKAVGIVGARMCTEYGRSAAYLLGKRLAELGILIISGMALGIDSASQAGALAGGGKTFAVLGCGVDICYPKSSKNIYENILAQGGGIISEFPPGTPPVRMNFPQRNRIISALSDVLVVVEAKKASGSLITADFALEQGKDIFAFPGRYDEALSYGCNRLISQGAGIIYDIDEFIDHIAQSLCGPGKTGSVAGNKNIVKIKSGKKKPSETQKSVSSCFSSKSDEAKIYKHIKTSPKHIEILIAESYLPLPRLLRGLENLKNTGFIYEPFKNYYCRNVL